MSVERGLIQNPGWFAGVYLRWDDDVIQPGAINPQGPDGAATFDTATGLLTFPHTTNNASASAVFQLKHSYKEGSAINFHLHWKKAADGAGVVDWQARYTWTNNGEVEADIAAAAWQRLTAKIPDQDTANLIAVSDMTVDGTGKKASSIFHVQFRRFNSGTGEQDSYNNVAIVMSIDIHYQKDAHGSVNQWNRLAG